MRQPPEANVTNLDSSPETPAAAEPAIASVTPVRDLPVMSPTQFDRRDMISELLLRIYRTVSSIYSYKLNINFDETEKKIDFEALFLKLTALSSTQYYKAYIEACIARDSSLKYLIIANDSGDMQVIRQNITYADFNLIYWTAIENCEFTVVAQSSLIQDPIQSLLLLGNYADEADIISYWPKIQAAFAENKLDQNQVQQAIATFQKTVMLSHSFKFTKDLFSLMQMPPPSDSAVLAAQTNDDDLLEFLWSFFPENRKELFSLLDFYSLCTEGRDAVLVFLRSKKNDFEREGITIDAGAAFGRPIVWALESKHENSFQVLRELDISNVEPTDCIKASDLQKFEYILSVCPPTFETLILAIVRDHQKGTELSKAKVSILMNSTIRISYEDYQSCHNWHGLERTVFFRYIDEYRDRCVAQHFIYECLLFMPEVPRTMMADDIESFIMKHREAMVYQPFIRDIINKTQDPHSKDNAAAALRLKDLLQANPFFAKIREFLFSGLFTNYPERLRAHHYLILLVLQQKEDYAIERSLSAQKFGCEKIYAALRERVDLIENVEFKLMWLNAAFQSGIFNEALNQKMVEEIKALRPAQAPHSRFGLFSPLRDPQTTLPVTLFERADYEAEEEDKTLNSNPFFQTSPFETTGRELKTIPRK